MSDLPKFPDITPMRAYEEGWQAGIRGEDPRTNPYDTLSQSWGDWNRAHGLACKTFFEPDRPKAGGVE